MDVDDIISPGSYFAAKQSKTQGKNAPKHSLKQSAFLAGEAGCRWPRVVCVTHRGKLPDPKSRLWESWHLAGISFAHESIVANYCLPAFPFLTPLCSPSVSQGSV